MVIQIKLLIDKFEKGEWFQRTIKLKGIKDMSLE